MKNQDPLQQYRALRAVLTSEREAIQKRLQELNAGLGDTQAPVPASPVIKKPGRPSGQATPAQSKMLLNKPAKKKGKMSAAGLANIRAAQKARWAKVHAAAPAVAKTEAAKPVQKKRKMSAAGRKAIAEANKKRWAKVNAGQATAAKPAQKKGQLSAAGRASIAAAQKARWAVIKAAKAKK